MDVVKNTLNIAGLLTNVYARPDLRDKHSSESIVVLFFLHGRGGSADDVDPTARAAFAWAAERQASSNLNPRDFIVVTFVRGFLRSLLEKTGVDDESCLLVTVCAASRTSGTTARERWTNTGTWDGAVKRNLTTNAMRDVEMYGMIVGAVKDVSFLIDVLPAYIFPNDERTVGEWVLAGFSLGGHATWLGLRQEPRIRIGIPICGCPNYLALIVQRAERLGIPCAPPYIPASLRALVRAHAADAAALAGKRVLVLAGADDAVVPWSASRTFVEALDVGRRGRKGVVVVPGVRHEFTDGMREEMFRFFWEEALVGGGAVRRSAL